MINVIKKLPLPIWLSLLLYRALNMWRLKVNKSSIESEILKLIELFCPSELNNKNLINDVKSSYVRHLSKPLEYFLFKFQDKSENERSEYLTDFIKDTYLKKYANMKYAKQLQDKFFVYKKMKPYFRRDACVVLNENDRSTFYEFVTHCPKFIAKPNTGSFGANTTIISVTDENKEDVFNRLLATRRSWILEELIEQVPDMAIFNPMSVNSVRIPTFRTNNGYEIFGTFMRVGRAGSCVDNAGAGGIFMKVDEHTGEIISDGFNEKGDRFVNHPDSNIQFKGFKIPYYNELKSLAIKCHGDLPEHKYVGWDFALTSEGWVLLEGNWGQFLCQQVSEKKPIKKEFINLIKS
ncbi:MAG: sugar-transfer associated ATP-grasp domain-containing protein [Bacteroidales bacterium]|nr:sugar-transfer associated ATP-grasp domain-containing protein [Bacteroidales bacterium]